MKASERSVMADREIAGPLGPDDPRRIGPFEILGLLGAGGMGEVYLGLAEGRYAAVKLVRSQVVSAERFQREVGILHRIPADVTPQVLASDGIAARPWLATEYVPGLTVDAAVRLCGRLDRDALWLLLAEVASVLSTVHEAGVVHRDLNPANVMLLRDAVRLIDFGIARAADQPTLTKAGSGYGTHGFTAPEQDAGSAVVAAPADVYSLGASLLYAAMGRAPHAASDIKTLRAIDEELAHIVERCLDADATGRPTAAQLVTLARDHVVSANPSWPPKAMERIETREAFVAAPAEQTDLGKAVTVPPRAAEEAETETDQGSVPPAVEAPRSRRRLSPVVIAPVTVLVAVGGITTFLLTPFGSAGPSRTQAISTAPTLSTSIHQSSLPSSTQQSPLSPVAHLNPLASRSSRPPTTAIASSPVTPETTTSPRTVTTTSSVAARGPAGPAGDPHYVTGSEVTLPGCAGWMDSNNDLYGTVSAGDAACSAQDIRTNSNVMAPGTVDFQASDYSQANGSGPVFYIIGYRFTEQVCIWNQSAPAVKACTPQYTDASGTVTKG